MPSTLSQTYIKLQKELNSQLFNNMWHLSFLGCKDKFRYVLGQFEGLELLHVLDLFQKIRGQLVDESGQLFDRV